MQLPPMADVLAELCPPSPTRTPKSSKTPTIGFLRDFEAGTASRGSSKESPKLAPKEGSESKPGGALRRSSAGTSTAMGSSAASDSDSDSD
jgi:hypothetical protein